MRGKYKNHNNNNLVRCDRHIALRILGNHTFRVRWWFGGPVHAHGTHTHAHLVGEDGPGQRGVAGRVQSIPTECRATLIVNIIIQNMSCLPSQFYFHLYLHQRLYIFLYPAVNCCCCFWFRPEVHNKQSQQGPTLR